MTDRQPPPFCPSCVQDQPLEATHCRRCGLDLSQPEVPRLREIWVRRRRLDNEWEHLVGQMWARRQAPAVVLPWEKEAQPSPSPRPKQEWSAQRVQNTLLSLGAVLCAVAAISFVAVAWGHIGLAGRALLMTVITVATAAGSQLALKRNLRSTAEAVGALTYGLLLIDFASAYSFDLFGLHSVSSSVYWSGALGIVALIGVGHHRATQLRAPIYIALGAAQLPISLALMESGASTTVWVALLSMQVIANCAAARVLVAQPVSVTASRLANAAALALYVVVSFSALATVTSLDAVDRIVPVMVVGLTAVVAVHAGGRSLTEHRPVSFTILIAAVTVDTLFLILQELEGHAVIVAVALVGALVTAGGVALRAKSVPRVITVGVLASVVALAACLAPAAWLIADVLGGLGSVWQDGAQSTWLTQTHEVVSGALLMSLAIVAATFAGAGHVARTASSKSRGLVSGLLVALYAVLLAPTWLDPSAVVATVTAAALATGCIYAARLAITQRATRLALLSAGTVAVAIATLTSLATPTLTSVTFAYAAIAAAALAFLDVKGRSVALTFATAFALALGVSVTATVSPFHNSVGLFLAVGGVLLAVPLGVAPRRYLQGAAATAVSAALFGLLMTVNNADSLSVSLVVLAAGSALIALLQRNTTYGWISSAFVIVLIWVRLAVADIGVVEAYSIPLAMVVLYAGLRSWSKNNDVGSVNAFGPGLFLAFGPSLCALVVADAPWRVALLLAAGTASVLVGARLRLKAPLIIGALVVLLVALVEGQPYFHLVPRWLVIGTLGAALVGIGATWEARRRDLDSAKQVFDAYR